MRRRRVFEFFIGAGPEFSFGLERASPEDFNPDFSPVFDGKVNSFIDRIKEHTCLVYRPTGEGVATYFWISEPGTIVPLSPWHRLRVPEGYRYIWDCKTDERVRGKGYYANGLREILSGGKHLIAVEGSDAARKATTNAGFAPLETIHTYGLWIGFVNGWPQRIVSPTRNLPA
jgi:hypothetical protein